MIASLHGRVLSAGTGWVVIDVGGVGMRAEVPSGPRMSTHPGDEKMLHTSLVVREDSLTLFGFETSEELEMFGILLGVSGVGPRSALGVLSTMTPAEIARAVQAEDDRPFRKVSGIGPKTAKLLAVSLAGKIDPLAFVEAGELADESASAASKDPAMLAAAAVEQGLVGLGWSETDAEWAVRDAIAAGAPTEQAALLRAALALLQDGKPGGGRR
ncbi:Holliday junction branch migration protein RuvA [Leucobacter sp. GX24907]